MFFKKTRERKRLLKFFYEVYFDNDKQSQNWEEEIFPQLKPKINKDRVKIYLIEFLENGWIEWDKERSDAYIITNKGIVYLRYNGFTNAVIANGLDKLQYWSLVLAAVFAIFYYGNELLGEFLRNLWNYIYVFCS